MSHSEKNTMEELVTVLSDESALATHLGITRDKLAFLVSSSSKGSLYHTFEIPKRNGGKRQIDAPRKDLKLAQKKLVETLSPYYDPRACVQGFVPNRSIVTNATKHVKKKYIVCIDLEDFFPSISSRRVYGLLRKRPFCLNKEVAFDLSKLFCSQDGLPQGAPSSPLISNIICSGMDRNLLKYAKQNGMCYTRYADDIVFSSNNKRTFERIFVENGQFRIPEELAKLITKYNAHTSFKINQSKVNMRAKCARQTVTGVTVNEKLNLPRNYYRTLRACLHTWRTKGPETAARKYFHTEKPTEYQIAIFEDSVRGKLDYYRMITARNKVACTPLQQLGSMFNQCCEKKKFPIHNIQDAVFLIDVLSVDAEGKDYHQEGTAFFLKDSGIVTAKHVFKNAKLVGENINVVMKSIVTKEKISFQLQQAKREARTENVDCSKFQIPRNIFDSQFPTIAPIQKEKHIALVDSEVFAFRVTPFDAGDLRVEVKSGKVKKLPRPNQFGSQAIIDGNFFHGMSGGPVLSKSSNVVGVVHSGSEEGMPSRYLNIRHLEDIPEDKVFFLE